MLLGEDDSDMELCGINDEIANGEGDEEWDEGEEEEEEDLDADHHYICFCEKGGFIYELDGLRNAPVRHCAVGKKKGDFGRQCSSLIEKQFIGKSEMLNFSALALSEMPAAGSSGGNGGPRGGGGASSSGSGKRK